MRIGLDLHIVDGIFQGSRTHVIELFSRVVKLCPEIDFILLLDQIDKFKIECPEFNLPNVYYHKLPNTGAVRRLVWELPRLQRRLKLDLLHTQYIIPLPSFSNTVVTIHDVLFESHPKYFTKLFRLRSSILMRIAAFQSKHVFTVSQYSSQEIQQRFGVPKSKITVIPNAADFKRFYPGNDGVEWIEKRGLYSGDFFLTVGRLEPRKNHNTLLKAYLGLGGNAPPLVIVGQKDFGFESMLEAAKNHVLRNKIIILEDVTDKELPALYRHCLAFVYPSLAEGFGMPPLEAMASGVPVIVADNTALSEVVGPAGLLVPSTDVNAMQQAMLAIVSDSKLRDTLIVKGLDKVRTFCWDSSAKILADNYRRILFLGHRI